MSDTITITPKERREWRLICVRGTNGNYARMLLYHAVPRLLCALEQTENRAENAEVNVAQITAERDWLANILAELHDTSLMLVDGAPEGSNRPPYWKEAAHRAIADNTVK